MIRGDAIICGTTTTGTGTLTLAATAVPPGGVDFDVFARATGIGFANSAVILVSYTIIEYTSSAFTTAKSHEKGIGTLTLGSSAGIANATLARTTVQTTATSLDSQPATQNIGGAAFSIATAANTLVYISPSAVETLAGLPPYVETAVSSPQGFLPLGAYPSAVGVGSAGLADARDQYTAFYWACPILAKKMRIQVHSSGAYTGGTSNAWSRIYAVDTSGRPGKLLIDFGVLGTANSSFVTGGAIISSAAHANGYFLTPGPYFACVSVAFSGGSGTPALYGHWGNLNPAFLSGGSALINGFGQVAYSVATTSGGATPSDPGNTTGYALLSGVPFTFALNTS